MYERFLCVTVVKRLLLLAAKTAVRLAVKKVNFFFFFLSHDLDEFQGCSNDLFLCRIVDVALPELSKVL